MPDQSGHTRFIGSNWDNVRPAPNLAKTGYGALEQLPPAPDCSIYTSCYTECLSSRKTFRRKAEAATLTTCAGRSIRWLENAS